MWSRKTIAVLTVMAGAAGGVTAVATAGGKTASAARPSAGRPTVQQGETAQRKALAMWQHFPAAEQPRAIVIPVGPGIVDVPRDQQEDLAIYHARWVFVPASAADVATARRDGWISVAAATHALRGGVKHAPTGASTLAVHARLGRASFITDRGYRRLPGWSFSFGRFRDRAAVLAAVPYKSPSLRRLDPDGVGNSEDGEQAVISDHGRTLKIFFIGGHQGSRPCDDSYSETTADDKHAVAFTVYEHPAPAPPDTACTLVGYTRTVLVHLAPPLGGRVLIDSTDAGAIPVASKRTFR